MPRAYQIVELAERTAAWWEWRRRGIGSSDAASILGEKHAPTAERLLLAKLQPPRDPARNFAREQSAARERIARALYCRTTGIAVQPACVQNLARPWQRASLDGLSADGDRALEIKCGLATYQTVAARQRPARHHVAQLQHILAVTGLPAIDYWCHVPNRPPLRLEVARDERYLERLLAAEEAFAQRLASSQACPT